MDRFVPLKYHLNQRINMLILLLCLPMTIAFVNIQGESLVKLILLAKPDLKKLETSAKIRPPFPNAYIQKGLTFKEYLELARLNVTNARQYIFQSKLKQTLLIQPNSKEEEYKMSEALQVIKKGATSVEEFDNNELFSFSSPDVVYPLVGVGSVAALAFLTQISIQQLSSTPTTTIASSSTNIQATNKDSTSIENLNVATATASASMNLPSTNNNNIEGTSTSALESRIVASMPPPRQQVMLTSQSHEQQDTAIVPILKDLSSTVTQFSNNLNEFTDSVKLSTSIDEFTNSINNLVSNVNELSSNTAEILDTKLTSALDSFSQTISKLAVSISDVSDTTKLTQSLDRFSTSMTTLAEKMSGVQKVLAQDILQAVPTEMESRVDAIANSVIQYFTTSADKFNSFLDRNPDLKLPASTYAAKLFQNQVQSTLNTPFLAVAQYLDKNSDLKLSTSEYVTRKVLNPLAAKVDTSISGVFESANAYLDKNPDLKLPTSTYVSKWTQNEFQPKIVKPFQASILRTFDNYLDANPDLKLSTSAYVSKWYDTQVVPRLESAAQTIELNTYNAIESTKSTATGVATRFMDQLNAQTAKVSESLFSEKSYSTVSNSDKSGINLFYSTSTSQINAFTDDILFKLSNTKDSIISITDKVLVASGPALLQAGGSFTEQLGAAGVKLVTNLGNFGSAWGRVAGTTLSATIASIPSLPPPTTTVTSVDSSASRGISFENILPALQRASTSLNEQFSVAGVKLISNVETYISPIQQGTSRNLEAIKASPLAQLKVEDIVAAADRVGALANTVNKEIIKSAVNLENNIEQLSTTVSTTTDLLTKEALKTAQLVEETTATVQDALTPEKLSSLTNEVQKSFVTPVAKELQKQVDSLKTNIVTPFISSTSNLEEQLEKSIKSITEDNKNGAVFLIQTSFAPTSSTSPTTYIKTSQMTNSAMSYLSSTPTKLTLIVTPIDTPIVTPIATPIVPRIAPISTPNLSTNKNMLSIKEEVHEAAKTLVQSTEETLARLSTSYLVVQSLVDSREISNHHKDT